MTAPPDRPAADEHRSLQADTRAGREAILRRRAQAIAREVDEPDAESRIELLLFQLAWETYGVETAFVREVFAIRHLTPIPCTPAFVLGIVNLRGELCPVIELKRLFGLPDSGVTNATSAVILQDSQMEFGILADVILGVHSVASPEIGPAPAVLSGAATAFLRGVTADRTVVLDAHKLLTHPGLIVDEQVGE